MPTVKTVTKTVVKKVKVQVQPKDQVSVSIQNVGSYKVDLKTNDTAFTVLARAASENNFALNYQNYTGMGAFVTGIRDINPTGNQYWSFYYNGKISDVGASSQSVSGGDTTFWELASF